MEINKRNRSELKSYFIKNSIPTESNFAEFIDAMLNQKEDGIAKPSGNPLSIEAAGDDTSQKKTINFYRSFADQDPVWSLSLNPRSDPNDPSSARPGFSVSDAQSQSRLFIDETSGNVGIGTTSPDRSLTVAGSGGTHLNVKANNGAQEVQLGADAGGGIVSTMTDHDLQLRAGKNSTKVLIRADGNVGIGTPNPTEKLTIGDGNILLDNGYSLRGARRAQEPANLIGYQTNSNIVAVSEYSSIPDEVRIYTPTEAGQGVSIYSNQLISFFRSDGNVGIGTNAPNSSLAVKGSTAIGGSYAEANKAPANGLIVQGSVGIGSPTPRSALDTGSGVMSGAANDYQKAQYTLSGGGTVTWANNRLKWTNRFIAISAERSTSFGIGFVDIRQPTTDIPASNVYNGQVRSVDANGVLLNNFEALYAVHTVGGNNTAVSFQVVSYTVAFHAPSNWIFVAVVNGDDRTVKLGTGTIISRNTTFTQGSGVPRGTIVMWSGSTSLLPEGWAVCNGTNGTPNLLNRFIVGAGNLYAVNTAGGANSVKLTTSQMPSHTHANGSYQYLLRKNSSGAFSSNGQDTSPGEPDVRTAAKMGSAGGNASHENRPPYHALYFIMKL